MNYRKLIIVVSIILIQGFLWMAIPDVSLSQLTYSVTDLGAVVTTGYDSIEAFGINNIGQVVGYTRPGFGDVHATLWNNSTIKDLGTLSGSNESIAFGINRAGQIAGVSFGVLSNPRATLWSDGTVTDLGTLGGSSSEARAINSTGKVVGASFTVGDNGMRATLWSNGTVTDLGALGGSRQQSYAYNINNVGQVVGLSGDFGDYTTDKAAHATLWTNGTIKDLGTLSGDVSSVAYGINNIGQAVGRSFSTGSTSHATLWTNGTIKDLGTLGGNSSEALSINNSGLIVGDAKGTDQRTHAFLYNNGSMTDLNSVINSSSGVILTSATAINDLGQIAAYGTINGKSRAFLLTPLIPSQLPQGTAYTQLPSTLTMNTLISNSTPAVMIDNTKEYMCIMSNSLKIYDNDKGAFRDISPSEYGIYNNKNTYVIVHGWNPTGEMNLPPWVTDMAKDIYDKKGQVNILAWDWMERAQSPLILPVPVSKVDAEAKTLSGSLKTFFGSTTNTGEEIYLLGHSLGSGIAATTAADLQKNNFNVERLTLWDGPAVKVIANVDLGTRLNDIDTSTGIIIENYISKYGAVITGSNKVNNINLYPYSYGVPQVIGLPPQPLDSEAHAYSYVWYDRTIEGNRSTGFNDLYGYGSNLLYQDANNQYQLNLSPPGTNGTPYQQLTIRGTQIDPAKKVLVVTQPNIPLNFYTNGAAYLDEKNGIIYGLSNSPVFLSSNLKLPFNADYLTFSLESLIWNEGDIFALYWDDTQIMSFSTKTLLIGEWYQFADIDFSNWAGTEGTITFALITAQDGIQSLFAVKDVAFYSANSVPEPTSMLLLGLGLMGLAVVSRKLKGYN